MVAGDVSRTGTRPEFAVFRDYITGSTRPRLGRAGDQFCFNPGNHDHWDGKENWPWVPAYNPGIFANDFEQTPYVRAFSGTGGPFELQVFGFDSNSGLAGQKFNPWAAGEISRAEFRELARLLRQSVRTAERQGQRVVRVIACHHAFARKNWWQPIDAYPLSTASRDTLLKMAGKYDVTAILTGHTHWFHIKKYRKQIRRWNERTRSRRPGYEIRSPTALQAGKVNLRNGFWAHEITVDEVSGHVVWTPELYLHVKDRFIPMPKKVGKKFKKIIPF